MQSPRDTLQIDAHGRLKHFLSIEGLDRELAGPANTFEVSRDFGISNACGQRLLAGCEHIFR